MNVFGLGVDTSLQCFIAAEEMGISEERGKGMKGTGQHQIQRLLSSYNEDYTLLLHW